MLFTTHYTPGRAIVKVMLEKTADHTVSLFFVAVYTNDMGEDKNFWKIVTDCLS